MAKTKRYFTFREELYRTHWIFSGLSKHHRIKQFRKAMWNAMPFQFDPQVSLQTVSRHSQLAYESFDEREITRREDGAGMAFHMMLPMEYHECTYWHMPAGVVWAETTLVQGHRIGMLYMHRLGADDILIDKPAGNMTTRQASQQGVVLFFLENTNNHQSLLFAGRFACGDALSSALEEDSRKFLEETNLEGVIRFTACGDVCDTLDDVGTAIDLLLHPDTMDQYDTQQIGRMAAMGSAHVLPFMQVFNAVKTSMVVPKVAGYVPSSDFTGDKFPMLNDKMIKHDIGLQGAIMVRYEYDSVSSGRRHAYHELAGYWRTRKNGVLLPRADWIWVNAHSRGDPSLGMSKRTYEKVKSDPTVSARHQEKMRQRVR